MTTRTKIVGRTIASVLVLVAVRGLHNENGAIALSQKQVSPEDDYLPIAIIKSTDPGKMRGKLKEKNAVFGFGLLNVLPFSKWPNELSKEQQKLKADAEKRFEDYQEGNSVITDLPKLWFYVANKPLRSDVLAADLYVLGCPWFPEKPASVGWGTNHVNIWMIQEGLTVYQRQPAGLMIFFATPLVTRDKRFLAAEEYAMANKKGIWKDKELATKLKRIANPELKE